MEVRIICLYAGGVSVWAKLFHSRITTGLFILALPSLRSAKCVGCHRNSWLKKRGSAVLLSVQSKHLDWQRAFDWTYSLTLLTRLILILPICSLPPFFQIGYSSRNRMFLQFKACMVLPCGLFVCKKVPHLLADFYARTFSIQARRLHSAARPHQNR